jgi:SAM-dependent methyltransferase
VRLEKDPARIMLHVGSAAPYTTKSAPGGPMFATQLGRNGEWPRAFSQANDLSAPSPQVIDYSAAQVMSPALDALSLKFVRWGRKSGLALDVGCGDGVATRALLARDGRVVAIDPDAVAIRRLIGGVPSAHLRRLKVRVAKLRDLEFRATHFSAIHAARVLHLLDPLALEQALRKLFRWLSPEGKLFISALTPRGAAWTAFQSEFRRREIARHPWPGYIDEASLGRWESRPTTFPIHLLDEFILTRELVAAGFLIEEIGTYLPPWPAALPCCSVVARRSS